MVECPNCHAQLKDDDWTCGKCGAPVAGAGMAAAPGAGGDYHAAYSSGAAGAPADTYRASPAWSGGGEPPAATPPASASSSLLRTILIIAVIAVIAIVAVWFFALRGPATSGDEFLGTWKATTQKGIGTTVITRKDEAFSVVISGSQATQKVTVPARLDGTELVITMDDFSHIAGEANAEQFKATLKALAGDFKLVFSSVDATHLTMRIVGKSPSGQDIDETIPLVKDTTGTT
jgi:hypothetical protein